MSVLATLKNEIQEELVGHIMPFWLQLRDEENGGFYGSVSFDLALDKKAEKGGIATARHLWSYSSAYRVMKNPKYLECADHAYDFFVEHILDNTFGGVQWMVDYKGDLIDGRKHVYAQAFGIYGLSEYYRITGKTEALDIAKSLFEWIEDVGFDKEKNVYKEEFSREFVETDNEMLSENGVVAEATTNTQLHVLEAYTNLYRIWPDQRVKTALENLVTIFTQRIYKEDSAFLKVFYTRDYEEIIDMQSYGHDIEASWLIDEALDVLGISSGYAKEVVMKIAENIKKNALADDGSLLNECEKGRVNSERIWWVQAEAMVGFYNAYEETGNEVYLELVNGLWAFTKQHIIDKRDGGEWYWYLEPSLVPATDRICEPWKTPYHNVRFCLEMIERTTM